MILFMLKQLRNGIRRLISYDQALGYITRREKQDDGTVLDKNHTLMCRISYESSSVYGNRKWEGGLSRDETPFVLADYRADIEQGDILKWRDKTYQVGLVSRPHECGGPVCTQAKLTEVDLE